MLFVNYSFYSLFIQLLNTSEPHCAVTLGFVNHTAWDILNAERLECAVVNIVGNGMFKPLEQVGEVALAVSLFGGDDN